MRLWPGPATGSKCDVLRNGPLVIDANRQEQSLILAERVGFEPTSRLRDLRFDKLDLVFIAFIYVALIVEALRQ
jgi:hypothetical protein